MPDLTSPPVGPPDGVVQDAVQAALREDIGLAGDITTTALIEPDRTGRASISFRERGVLAGTWTTDAVCATFDLMVVWDADDGDVVDVDESAAELEGSLADLLTAERTILNFLTHLSGIASLTRRFVDAAGSGVLIRDTRKTTPGLRALEKAAVRAGGGLNHRMGLFDAILIKDNHLGALDRSHAELGEVVERAMRTWPGVVVEVEADTVAQAKAAADAGCDLVLVDNMAPDQVGDAVSAVAGSCAVEVSGGVTLENVADYADCGADYIAVGALTHSAPSIDIGIDLI